MSNKKEASKLVAELEKRNRWNHWKDNPEAFFAECLQIYPKDASLGLIPLKINSAQKLVVKALNEQMADTGYI